jgi:hypothetical protein
MEHRDKKGTYFYNWPVPKKATGRTNLTFGLQNNEKNLIDSNKPSLLSYNHLFVHWPPIFNNRQCKKLQKKGLDIYLYEPICYIDKHQKNYSLNYYSEFHSQTSYDDIIPAEILDISQKNIDLNCEINVYTCDYNIANYFGNRYKNLNLFCYDLFLRQMGYAHWDYCSVFNPNNISKKFFSSNDGRYIPFREIILSHLIDKDGLYSWPYCSSINWKRLPWFESKKIDTKKLLQNRKTLNSNNYFIDIKRITKTNIGHDLDGTINTGIPLPTYEKTDLTLPNAYEQIFCCIATETRFAQPNAYISEKTLLPIWFLKPFIVVSAPYSLEYMKKLGFKTFDNYWDESYDTTTNHTERLKKIMDVIDYIDSLSIKQLKELYQDMFLIIMHNFEVVRNLNKDRTIL